MNVSKILVSSIAAVSVVGAISLAYAQTSTTTDVPANSTGPMTPGAVQSPSTTPVEVTPSTQLNTPVQITPQTTPQAATPNQPRPDSTINSTVNNPTSSSDSGLSNERAAQVDRN